MKVILFQWDDDEELEDVSKELTRTSSTDDDGESSTTEEETMGIDNSRIYSARGSREIGVGGGVGMMDSETMGVDLPRHISSVGSPGVPGRPQLHPTRFIK